MPSVHCFFCQFTMLSQRPEAQSRINTEVSHVRSFALFVLSACLLAAAEDDLVFRSDVSLVRVDTQVVDRNNRAVTGLTAEDFVVRENGQAQKISAFGSEDMPVDVLLLLDVSGSMRPHIERVAAASRQALDALGDDDRVAIMVFDRQTRLRAPFRRSAEAIERELYNTIQQETFDGGTDITRALYDATAWIGREARRDARRAIVILTDDQTERGRDEAGVGRALTNSNAVLSALLAADALGSGRIGIGTGGGGLGGPLGGIIWPPGAHGWRRSGHHSRENLFCGHEGDRPPVRW